MLTADTSDISYSQVSYGNHKIHRGPAESRNGWKEIHEKQLVRWKSGLFSMKSIGSMAFTHCHVAATMAGKMIALTTQTIYDCKLTRVNMINTLLY